MSTRPTKASRSSVRHYFGTVIRAVACAFFTCAGFLTQSSESIENAWIPNSTTAGEKKATVQIDKGWCGTLSIILLVLDFIRSHPIKLEK
jgi:hypothetical protein